METQREEHDRAIDILDIIYRAVEEHDSLYLDEAFISTTNIKCEELPFEGSEFFEPWSLDRLHGYPINMNNERTNRSFTTQEERWQGPEGFEEDPKHHALFMCNVMDRQFVEYPRAGIENGTRALMALTDWLVGDFMDVIDDDFDNSVFHRVWTPRHIWEPRYENFPHAMFTMEHALLKNEQEDLLRGEVLAIAAAMITRLEQPDLKDHVIIPIMVISFMGEKQGRILQAYFNSQDIVIYKTPFCDFSTVEKARPNINLFLRYMASDLVGETEHFSAR